MTWPTGGVAPTHVEQRRLTALLGVDARAAEDLRTAQQIAQVFGRATSLDDALILAMQACELEARALTVQRAQRSS